MLNNTRKYYLEKGMNCAETILALANDEFNLKLEEKNIRIMAGFGGGMYEEETCGVVTGGIAALSMIFDKEQLKQIVLDFKKQIKNVFSSNLCSSIKPIHRSEIEGCFMVIHNSYEILRKIILKNK
jgi:C_GCAxxG_C_C family probable redox protein